MSFFRLILGLLVVLRIASASIPFTFDQRVTVQTCEYDQDVSGSLASTTRSRASSIVPSRWASASAAQGDEGLPWKVAGLCRKFTGKERDGESQLDYFLARYCAAPMGRFLSVDPSRESADPIDPQTWNRYTYSLNNPLKHVDPDGRVVETAWDIFNVGIGLGSFFSNLRTGNYQAAALDAAGVAFDTASVLVPGAPGGAGALIKARKAASQLGDLKGVVRAASEAAEATVKLADEDVIRQAVKEAVESVGTGSGSAHGIRLHRQLEDNVKALGRADVTPEVSYKGGEVVRRGSPGSVRPDVVVGDPSQPKALYDLKTGRAKLSERRKQQIQKNLPPKSQDVPIREIRPDQR